MASERRALEGGWILVHDIGQHSYGGAWYLCHLIQGFPPALPGVCILNRPLVTVVHHTHTMIISILVAHNPDSELIEGSG